jgi:SAM-dependent methyltransferase
VFDARDGWTAGATYEAFMGRWSRMLAPRFVAWLRPPAQIHWLDVGCGTGALTEAICLHADPLSVLGCDPARSFIEYARTHAPDRRASFLVAGTGSLPSRPGGYGSIASLLALNFFPDPSAAIEEMRSLAARRAVVSACVWDYVDGMEFLRRFWDAAASEDSGARELDEGERFPICRPDALAALFRAARLDNVRCEPIEIATEFASFDEYWSPLLGGTGPAPSYVGSLAPDRRASLALKLERALPRRSDGTIALVARAWAIRGTAN